MARTGIERLLNDENAFIPRTAGLARNTKY